MKSWILAGVMFSAAAAMGVSVAFKVRRDEIRNTLTSMMSAEETATYTAEVTVREKDRTMRFRVVKYAGRTFLEPLDGERRGRGPRGGPQRGPIVDLDLLLTNYDVDIERTEFVAGRAAKRVVIRPIRANRSGCTLWVDRETSVLLKMETPDRTIVTETIVFEAKPVEARPREDRHSHYHEARGRFEPRREGKPEHRELQEESLSRAVSFPVALPSWLPAGFKFHKAGSMKWGSQESVYVLYTDGLATISMFEMPENSEWARKWDWLGKKGKDGDCKAGKVAHGGRTTLTVTLDGVVVSVTGTIPEAELVDMMGSMEVRR